ncbi:hypothetical protein [Paenibacillus kobensis]|uniref:hypothetical protein n=1 Tax=Paenibacillus kobensis TaxID=59841 RepID=UPI000FD870E7|nr:hypothetical protein [Paenibacillus kobensis]
MLIGIVMLAAVAASFLDYRTMIKGGGRWRELLVSVSILMIGIGLSILHIFQVELPSPLIWIEYMFSPIHRIVVPLFT